MLPIICARSWISAALVLGFLVIGTREAAAEVSACAPKKDTVAVGDQLAVDGFPTVDHVEKGTGNAWSKIEGWTPGERWTSADTEKLKEHNTDHVRLVFAKADHSSTCAQVIQLDEPPPPPKGNGSSDSVTPASFEACRAAGEAWNTEISHQSRGNAYTVMVFMRSGEICYANRLQGPQGDPIYVGIYSERSDSWGPVEFSPCSLQDAGPAIFVGADAVRLSGAQDAAWSILKIAPRSCYNDSVAIKASGKINSGTSINVPAQVAFQYQQYKLYRATLQLGTDFTIQHASDFGLVTNGMGQSVIHNSAATGRGPEYVISLVIYGLPHYIHSFVGGPAYDGRDILHQQDWTDRIGLVTGVGLTDPTRRFILGASLEVMYGLNVLFVGEAFRHSELDGVAVGDVFTGAAGDIPTHDVWHTKFVIGLSLDLRYVQEIFSGRVHP